MTALLKVPCMALWGLAPASLSSSSPAPTPGSLHPGLPLNPLAYPTICDERAFKHAVPSGCNAFPLCFTYSAPSSRSSNATSTGKPPQIISNYVKSSLCNLLELWVPNGDLSLFKHYSDLCDHLITTVCPPWTISSRRARAMLDFVIVVWPVLSRVSHIHYEFGVYSLS